MASVEQAKDVLEQEREHAAQMTEKALSAIDAVVAVSSQTLTALAIVIGLIGIFGAAAIVLVARNTARKVAIGRIRAYIDTEEGRKLIRSAISDEVDARIRDKIMVMVHPNPEPPASSPKLNFPPPPTVPPRPTPPPSKAGG